MSAARISRWSDVGAGRPIVLVHGWTADGDFFTPQRDLARFGWRVIAPDLPGHGPEARPDPSLTLADLADALGRWMADLGLDRPLVLGWSMGAAVLLDLLGRDGAPEVAGLVILDMTPKVANDPDWPLGLSSGHDRHGMEALAPAMATHWSAVAPRIARALFARDRAIDTGLLAFAESRMLARDGATMGALWRSLAGFDGRATLARLELPRLVLTGAESRIYGPALLAWYRDLPGITRAWAIPEAGHAPHLERPELFADALVAFAREVLVSPDEG